MTKGLSVGYIRVSTTDQNPDRQLEGIELDKKFIDFASGKDFHRKEFDNMISYIREGDRVIVHSIDRIARNLANLLQVITLLNEKNISIHFIKENLIFEPNTSDFRSTLLLSILGALSQFEVSLLRERQMEGINLARAQGRYPGRPKTLSDEQEEEIKALLNDRYAVSFIAKKFNVSRPIIYDIKNREK